MNDGTCPHVPYNDRSLKGKDVKRAIGVKSLQAVEKLSLLNRLI
jgi:hypothetical protein